MARAGLPTPGRWAASRVPRKIRCQLDPGAFVVLSEKSAVLLSLITGISLPIQLSSAFKMAVMLVEFSEKCVGN
eukprot:3540977-Amphidinium_carterae.1